MAQLVIYYRRLLNGIEVLSGTMEHAKRHKTVWLILRPIVDVLVRILYKYTPEYADVPGPFLVLCNHNTDWDPLLMGISFRKE